MSLVDTDTARSYRELLSLAISSSVFFFFFNDTAITEIYTLSLHDALPIYGAECPHCGLVGEAYKITPKPDRKSTRLNSSHVSISYAVFCLKKKIDNDARRDELR